MDSQQHFQSHFEQAPFSMQLLGPDGRTIAVNRAWRNLWCIPEEIIQNYILKDYRVADDPQLEKKGIAGIIKRGLSGEIVEIPAIYYDPKETGLEGSPKWVTGHMYPILTPQGQVQEIVLTHHDITKRILAEEELRRSRDQLKTVIDGVLDGILVQDKNFQTVFANTTCARLCGFSSVEKLCEASLQELLETFEICDEEGKPLPLEKLPARRALSGQGPQAGTIMRFRSLETGLESWAEVSSRAVLNAQGEADIAVSIIRDISEEVRRRKAEDFLGQASSVLSTSLDFYETLRKIAKLAVSQFSDWCTIDILGPKGPETVTVEHEDPNMREFAREYTRRFPKDWSASTGSPNVLRSGKEEYYPQITDESLKESFQDPEQLDMIRRLGLKSVMIVPIRVAESVLGAITLVSAKSGYIFTEYDLKVALELGKRTALALENASLYQKLQKAVEARDEFISICSHELNTPITSMKLQLEIIKRQFVGNGGENRIAILSRQLNRMARLIDEMLDISRVQAGKLSMEYRVLDVRGTLQDSVGRFKDEFDYKGIKLHLNMGDEECWIEGDQFRLEQVYANLLSNALKYGENKPLEVTVRLLSERVQILFRDYGRGIDPASYERIFERFERVGDSRNITGLGLGLFISREIITAHGGRIWAEPAPDEGSIFIVELPRKI